jgi:hypothetical protein
LLDPVELLAEIRKRLPSRLPAWNGWELANVDNLPLVWANRWKLDEQGSYSYRLCVRPAPVFALSRRLQVAPGHECLVVAMDRSADGSSPSQIEVRLNGRSAARFDVPTRPNPASEPDPLAVFLHSDRGRDLEIELVSTASDENSYVDWRSLGLVSRPPRLYRWFEDEARFLAGLPDGSSQAKLVRDDKYSGTDSVRLTPGDRSNANYPGLRLPVRYQPQLGEYRYLRVAWRKRGAGRVCVQLAHDGRFGPDVHPGAEVPVVEMPEGRSSFRYDAGVGPPSLGSALRVLEQPLGNEWHMITRDLYADFGGFDLTGISLVVPDGDEAYFDHIYLARLLDDFRWIDRELAAERDAARLLRLRRFLPMETDDPVLARKVVDTFAPGFEPGVAGACGVALVEEHAGRRAVLRITRATSEGTCLIRGVVEVAWGRKTQLHLSVAHEAGRDDRLVVKANGQSLLNASMNASNSKDGWCDLAVDLSQFAGQKFGVALEIEQVCQAGQTSPAYWSRLEVLAE